jgi:CO/xanthine dehydrogenase Mo-binding subunit
MTMTDDARERFERVACSRRSFLKSSGLLLVSFSTAGPGAAEAGQGPFDTRIQQIDPRQLDAWLAIDAQGAVTAYTGKCELGQGIATAQVQLVAEELSVAPDRVRLVECDTSRTPDQGTTSGSQSTPVNFNARNLAQACATARETLLQLGSERLGLPIAALVAVDGAIAARADATRRASYGALLAGRTFDVPVNAGARRKAPDEWTVLGTSVPRADMAAMVTGELQFVHHVRLPDMRHGAVVRPPAVGAALVSVDEGSIRDLPGAVRVVTRGSFVGVVADTWWQAVRAARQLKVTWSPGAGLPARRDFYDDLRRATPSSALYVVRSDGFDDALATAPTTIEGTYLYPYQMHGSVGTSCAVADVRGGEATIWSATQSVYPLRSGIGMLLDLPPEAVRVIYVPGSGCYGLNGADTVSYDAALLSRAVGRPVRVQLSRQDEMAWENYGYAYAIDQRLGLDAEGTITAWDYEAWFPVLGNRPGANRPGNVITGSLVGFEPATVGARSGPPPVAAAFNNGSNAAPSYVVGASGLAEPGGTGTVAHERVLTHRVRSPFFTGPLRSPSRLQNTFAHECILDEAAARVGADPVAYRLRHLRDPRLREVIVAAAKASGWQARPSPAPGNARTGLARGRGIACVLYEGDNGYCAMVAEAEVDRDTGRVQVTRLVIGHDCGPISNPDGLRNQLEGGALQGMSRALVEEVTWDDQTIASIDWNTYRSLPLGFAVPAIECVLIDRTAGEAMGAGETTITVAAAAIGNAIFDATGARVRQVPFTPDRVRAALDARAQAPATAAQARRPSRVRTDYRLSRR